MANLTRYDPFAELAAFDPFGNSSLRNWLRLRPLALSFDVAEPQIRIDVAEDGESYTVKAEIPGMKKEDIHVSVEGNHVSISTETRKEQDTKEGRKLVRSERYVGRVSRAFTLDQDVDAGAARAKYTDGVLELVLPKRAGSDKKRIAVA